MASCTGGPNGSLCPHCVALAALAERMKLDPEALYWSEQGQIACGLHAPFRGSDTWRYDRWRKMTVAEVAAVTAAAGRCRCEVCG